MPPPNSPRLAIFLLLTFVLSISATTIPVLKNLTSGLTNTEISCTPAPALYRRDPRPKSLDCHNTIPQLPQLPNPGTFHPNGPDDGFRLPKSRSYGSCQVTVKLRDGSLFDQSSWLGIGFAASNLLNDCQRAGRFGDLRTGGWRTMGIANNIVVELTKVRVSEAGVGGNLTMVDEKSGLNGIAVK